MYKGDISNESPKRVMVAIDPLLITTQELVKITWYRKRKFATNVMFDRLLLNKLNLYAMRNDLNLTLVSFTHSEDEVEKMMAELDRANVNPFRHWQVYKSVDKLVKELPYRPDVVGVIDIPERRLMYGHWAIDF